jgi:hypothetical protein
MYPSSRLPSVCVISFVLSLAQWLGAADGPEPLVLSPDLRALQKAGIATDVDGLLDYFRRRTPSEAQQAVLKQRASQLGSSVYVVRAQATDDLIRAGRAALPWLRDVAGHGETETARRAAYCIQIIEANTRLGLSATASRVLAERKTPGAAEALLAYLPFIDESWVEEEIRQSLKQVALIEGKAIVPLEQALADKEAKRRAAAAWIVGMSSDPLQRAKVHGRLSDDVAEVRFLAASSLLAAHEPKAVPTLIALLSVNERDIAWRSEDLLFRLAGEQGPALWLDVAQDHQNGKVQLAWANWWKLQEGKIDWKASQLDAQALGLTLVAESQRSDGGGKLYEINAAGVTRWQVSVQNPIDAQWLSGGRLLIGDSRASLIYEIDTHGSIAWKHFGISPTSLQRLPNGNTLISTYQKIIELSRDGKITFEYATQGHTYHARKTADNRYLWIDACGEIGEIDETGKLLAKTKVGGGLAWGSIEPLRNGRCLVALGGIGKVLEVDMKGKIYWEKAVSNPNRAVRLANGHTLVASHGDRCIYEFDAQGNERWKHFCAGRPFAVQRR